MDLFGCASDSTGKDDASVRPLSAISPEDEASELRGLDALKAKLEARGASAAAIAAFVKNYEAMAGGDTGIIAEGEIEAIKELPDLKSVRYACALSVTNGWLVYAHRGRTDSPGAGYASIGGRMDAVLRIT